MKRLPLALSAVALSAGSALAADLPARSHTKAPQPVVVAPSWTGFYVFGGAGGGFWDADNGASGIDIKGVFSAARDTRVGGHGVFGTVGAGYIWQLAGPWITGVFADGMFGSAPKDAETVALQLPTDFRHLGVRSAPSQILLTKPRFPTSVLGWQQHYRLKPAMFASSGAPESLC